MFLNIECLKAKEVVPDHWQLSQSPTYTKGVAIVDFDNGVRITHQGNIFSFSQEFRGNIKNLEVPGIAQKYIDAFLQGRHRAIGINIEGYTVLETNENADNYLFRTLFSSNFLQDEDNRLAQIYSTFVYEIDRGQLNLTVQNTELPLEELQSIPVIVFAANFHRDINNMSDSQMEYTINHILEDCQSDLKAYRDIVSKKFMNCKIEEISAF